MAVLLIYPVLALMILSLDYRITKYNYDVPQNGYGSLEGVIDRNAPQPAQYRVLMPWLFHATRWLLGGREDPPLTVPIYLFWKWVFMTAAMMVASHFFSPVIALALGLYWVLTLQYDYWSVYSECLAFLLVLTGSLPLACLGVIIGALSKDTAVVLPFIFPFVVFQEIGLGRTILATEVLVALCGAALVGVRMYQGEGIRKKLFRKPMNCAFPFVWGDKNKRHYFVMGWGVIIVSLIAAAHYRFMPEPFKSTAWVLPVMCAASFSFALVHEPRVMAVNIIWWAALLVR